MIPIKSEQEIAGMRDSCRIAATVLDRLVKAVAPGMNTYDLDQEGRRLIESFGARSACYDYRMGTQRYPAYTCLSVNEEIVHGIGSLRRVLQPGDIITVDVCVIHNGWVGDNAQTVAVGPIEEPVARLLESTKEALDRAIAEARPGRRVGDISHAIESFIRPRGFGIVRDFVGHGVGRSMHEEPQIPNFGRKGTGDRLRPGMTLAIEPMITLGDSAVRISPDGWTAVTCDGSPSAHFEHTVLIRPDGPEVLTVPVPECTGLDNKEE